MRRQATIRQLKTNQQGAAALEFALVAGVLFMLMFGIIEYGLIMMTKIAVESATVQVARSEGIGFVADGCSDRVCTVKKLVQQKTYGLIHPQSVIVTSTVVSSSTTTTPPVPDICLLDVRNPYPPTCSRWQENGGTPDYDPPSELNPSSIGAGNEIVEIRVTYLWRVLFPIFRSYFGENGVLTITSATVVKNEPFPAR